MRTKSSIICIHLLKMFYLGTPNHGLYKTYHPYNSNNHCSLTWFGIFEIQCNCHWGAKLDSLFKFTSNNLQSSL